PKGSPKTLKFAGVAPTGPLPKSIDFALTPQDEPDKFRAILFGDPQPRNQTEVDYIAHDVVEELVGTQAAFGVTLGDIVFDDLSLFESQAKTIALLGIPWYNVIGNHDINRDVKHDSLSDETFESVFGPSYYSFDHGPVHFMVLDDIEWYLAGADGKGTYRGGLGPQQMEFIRNDLALIPKQQLVVLLMHVPLVDVRDRQELYRLIEQRPFCISISGHTHHHEHRFITREDGWMGPQPHHHIINVTVSGSWWSGAPDERGIPHTTMADGAPNGYSIMSFDGQKYALDFRAAGRSADYQMQIHAPELIRRSQASDTDVYVNVFNGSERSVVEMRLGHKQGWQKMERTVAIDPAFKTVVDNEAAVKDKTWRALPNPKPSTHLWRARLPEQLDSGTHLIEIRATDWQQKRHTAQRVIRVSDD
ncbi:MAG: calcineurin-like phosphoesterase C-terminal domain-containing protein, partial [Planctomycetaceae bacterium]